jgi:hypothetical protein
VFQADNGNEAAAVRHARKDHARQAIHPRRSNGCEATAGLSNEVQPDELKKA